VPESEEWGTLVKQSKSWKNLCNLLLNAGVKPVTVTIETVFKELEEIQKAKPGLSYRWFIAAGLGLIICAAVLVMIFRRPPPPEKTEWESLCNQYQTLIDGLRRELADKQVDWMLDEGKLYIREIKDHPEYAEQQKTQDALTAIEEISDILDPNSPTAWLSLANT